MRVYIGLGNPGDKYKNNRHNAGHMLVDFIKSRYTPGVSDSSFTPGVRLLKTDVFMNVSGVFVKKHALFPLSDLYIIHDDLDIPLGKFKIQFGTGPKLHNGIRSIEQELGTNEFWRIRVGVDARQPENPVDGEAYSLQDFTNEEMKQLQLVFEKIYKQLNP